MNTDPSTRSSSTLSLAIFSPPPSISQLAELRAISLDLSQVTKSPPSSGQVSGYGDAEKLHHESDTPNSNTPGTPIMAQQPLDLEPATPSLTRSREIALIFITCIAQFLSLAALLQTLSPVMILADYFHVEDYGTLSWFSASYSMSVGTFILPAGRLGDMYGHKRIYLIGWAWFATWSLISGFSYSSGVVLFSICRAFQGIGPALLVPNAVALIGRNFPVGQKRNIGFALFGAMGPTGATTGAVFAALLADLAWWPWEFWILSVVCCIVLGLAFFIIPDEDAAINKIKGAQRPSFDYWGSITGVTGLILINFALNQAPLVTWMTPYIGALLGVGCLFMVAFVLVELYATEYPLIPIRGLSKDAVFALTCIFVGWSSHGIWNYYLFLFLEHLREHSALLASAETAPVAFTGFLFALSTVWLLKRIGVAYVMFIAMTFFMLGALLLATMPLHQTYWAQTFISVLIMPGAMNLSYPAANILLSSSLPKEKQGIAASLVSTLVNYSISCGLGFAGTLDRYIIAKEAKRRGFQGGPHPLQDHSPNVQSLRLVAHRAALWFAAALGGLGMVVAAIYIAVTAWRKSYRR